MLYGGPVHHDCIFIGHEDVPGAPGMQGLPVALDEVLRRQHGQATRDENASLRFREGCHFVLPSSPSDNVPLLHTARDPFQRHQQTPAVYPRPKGMVTPDLGELTIGISKRVYEPRSPRGTLPS